MKNWKTKEYKDELIIKSNPIAKEPTVRLIDT